MIKDSGIRHQFESGAVRDMSTGKGRFDLLPQHALARVAELMEEGARKYDDGNCFLGIPNHSFVDSASRHLSKFVRGEWDEPHLVQAAWNLLMAVDQQERIKKGLLDGKYDDIGVRVVVEQSPEPEPTVETEQHEYIIILEAHDPTHCPNYTPELCESFPCVDCELSYVG